MKNEKNNSSLVFLTISATRWNSCTRLRFVRWNVLKWIIKKTRKENNYYHFLKFFVKKCRFLKKVIKVFLSFLDICYCNIQLGTKKSPPLFASFFVLTITLSFLEFEWKILYRWEAKMLNFFMLWKFFLYFEDILTY